MSDLTRGDLANRGLGLRAALARNWWALVIRGALALLFGVMALLWPGVTLGTLILVFGIYVLVDGVFAIVAGLRAAARHERWGLLALEGIIGIIVGLAAIVIPGVTVVVWIWVLAVWAILTGVLMIAAAVSLPSGHRNWLLALGGAVSLVWGVLLAAWPLIGAVVLTIWLGAYALIFGFSMVTLGLRLRAWHGSAPTSRV